MAWDALEVNAGRVSTIVQSAAQAVSHLREASYALQVLEEVRAAQQRSLGQQEKGAKQHGPCGQQSTSPRTAPSTSTDSSTGGGGSSSGANSSASASAQDASEQVEAALVELLLSQRQGQREQQHAFDHLRMVLETYVSARCKGEIWQTRQIGHIAEPQHVRVQPGVHTGRWAPIAVLLTRGCPISAPCCGRRRTWCDIPGAPGLSIS